MKIDEKIIYYWLANELKLTNRKQNELLGLFDGDALRLWESFESKQQQISGLIGKENFLFLKNTQNLSLLEKKIISLNGQGIEIITRNCACFPQALKQPEVNPPILLYAKGNKELLNRERMLSVVGTRHSTKYGKDVTENFVKDLVLEKFVIVSGMATGIDCYAHQFCIDNEGDTIAVLGSGFNQISPTSHVSIANKIAEKGLLISEYPPNFIATKYSYPQRNRLISALSKGVLVIEAGDTSGALITVEFAHEQGREVYAVPGNVNSRQSIGTNHLIKTSGAHFVTCAQDIFEDMKIPFVKNNKKIPVLKLDINQSKIYNVLNDMPLHFDKIVELTGIEPRELLTTLSSMTMQGIVKKVAGNSFSL